MKRHIFIYLLFITTVIMALVGCSHNKKEGTETTQTTEVTTETTTEATTTTVQTSTEENTERQSIYEQAEQLYSQGKDIEALQLYWKTPCYHDANEKAYAIMKKINPNRTFSASANVIALKNDNTVNITRSDDYETVKQWKDVISVYIFFGKQSFAIKKDRTVLASSVNIYGEGEVEDWTNIVDVVNTNSRTFGLRSNGTVVMTGGVYGGGTDTMDKLNIAKWNNIISIEAGNEVYGLRADGTVAELPEISSIKREDGTNVTVSITNVAISNWNNIKAISSSGRYSEDVHVLPHPGHLAGLKYDGTVVDTYYKDVDKWTNITAIETGREHTVGLKSDGTVVAVGANKYGECNVSNWYNIKAIYTGPTWTIGLKNDGTVVATGKNTNNQCNVSDWTDIVDVDACDEKDYDLGKTVGLKSDGTLVTTDPWFSELCKDWNNIKLPE